MGPAQIQQWLDDNSHRLDLACQFLGDEPNAVRKPWESVDLRVLLAAAWPYEQAVGNSSIPAVYQCVNATTVALADRSYLPATPRDLNLLAGAGLGLFGVETKHPARDFDIVATSISYPVLSMSFVKQLTVAGLPARWRDRAPDAGAWPMVMVGGLSYGAPEVLAPVVDCWWLGEAEDEPANPGIAAVCERIAAMKADGGWAGDRIGCYDELAREFGFLYFPRHITIHYGTRDRRAVGVGPAPSKQVIGWSATLPGLRLPLRRRHVRDLDAIAPLAAPPLLYADPALGAGDLEVGRGCPAWCSFCALTYRQKPYRQRSVDYTVEHAKALRDNLGSVRLTPFSPDFPMHTQRKALVAALLEQVCDEVDASTMRVDDFIADPEFITLQVAGGMHTVTLGVEGTSQRMRDLVGKGTADADICEAVTRGIAAGIRRFKLFMISGLPGEDEGDVYRILALAKNLADIRESMAQPTVRIQLSWTPLMIEANTPMQWFAPTAASRVLADVFDELRELGIDFKLGAKAEPNKALFFQLCHRASRDVGEALVDAMTEVDTACWGGVPRTFAATLETTLRRHGFANGSADCFDERAKPDLFGHEFIDQGINVELLWTTYLQMREFAENTTSHTYDTAHGNDFHGAEWVERCDTRCQGKTCGACDHTDLRIRTGYLRAIDRATSPGAVTPVDQRSQAVRVRARLLTGDRYRMVGNDHHRFALRRAAHRAQTSLTDGPHGPVAIAGRSIRFASDTFAHRAFTAGVDYAEFALTRPLVDDALTAFLTAMATELAPWRHLDDHTRHPATARGLLADVHSQLVDLHVDFDPTTLAARLRDWGQRPEIPIRCHLVGGYFAPATETVNAHDHVDALWTVRAGHQLRLRMLLRGRPSPYAIAAALFGRPSWLDLARHPAHRLEVYAAPRPASPPCPDCGRPVPANLLGHTDSRCPPCHDQHTGARHGPVHDHRLERTPA